MRTIKKIPFETYIHGHVEPMTKEQMISELKEELRGTK